jgi:DNA topoisomerase IA
MGASQSTATKKVSKVIEEPILHSDAKEVYPTPTGQEYDVIDKLAAELPNVIDDESRQQVEDYKQACDNGKGPMVRSML